MSEREPSAAGLREAKRELLARLLAEEGIAAAGDAIPRRAEGSVAPLSHAQELLWLLDRATPGLTAYNSVLAFRLSGPLDIAALQRALAELVSRHEALRTRFGVIGEQPVQLIGPPGGAQLVIEDLRGPAPESREREAAGRLRSHARQAFDLERNDLFRPVLIRLTEEDSQLLLLTHHIVSDAWSGGVMLRELSALYNASRAGRAAGLPAPTIQFADYAAWERRELVGERLEERLRYWRDNLLPPPPDLALPTDHPRPAAPTFEGGRAMLVLPRPMLDRLKALAAGEGATLYMILLAAYQALLHRWSGQNDVVIGSAIAGRTRSETEGTVGYFSGALPLRTRFTEDDSFRSLLARVRGTVLGALEHQNVPIEALIRELQAEGRPGHAPLFQAVLTMQETVGGGLALTGLEATPLEVETGATKFDLTLLPTERPAGLELLLWYRSDLFEPETADRLLGHLATMLQAAAENPEIRVDDLPLLTADEQAQLTDWNATARDLGPPTTITALIQAAATRTPGSNAVVAGDRSLTWAELAARGHRLAHRLQALGVGPDVPVGLCLDRSVELIVGMYGILAAGGAYVPLLPDQPAARLARQVADSGATIVVTTAAHRGLLPAETTVLCLDLEREELDALPTSAPGSATGPAHLAYVLFTSGSTGAPKGVAVTHANLVHYTRAIAASIGLDLSGSTEPWHCATVSTLAADLGHTSVFPALCSGGTLHVLPSEVVTDAGRFQQYVATHPLDLLKITPGHFQALTGPECAAAHLPRRWLVLGGEPCPWGMAEGVRSRGICRVLNHYGPTETTVGGTTFEVGGREVRRWTPATVPIGRPLPNVTTQVYDPRGHLVPVGIPGELWLGGSGVARGYLGRDELTQERFVDRAGARLYRTGDRVRRLPSGDLEFLGRIDSQVKVRGHRVELGEVETVLAAHPAVRQAVVALYDARLVGYVVLGGEADDGSLTAHAALMLPDYMVPAIWVRLTALPLNANGKVDRGILPAPPGGETAVVPDGAPRNETEQRLAAIWAEVLKREHIGIHENFFALGGHSLLAIRLLGRIAKAFGPKLPLRMLFEHPTVAALAPKVEA